MFSPVVRLIAPVFLAAILAFHHAGAADTSTTGKHFLWRVTNAPQPFYVLGSFHALHGSDYPLGSPIDSAIGECKRFVFEFDFKHAEQAGYEKKMRDAAYYPRGVGLKQKVQPQTYAFVQKIAKIRASEYDKLKPWAIAHFMMRNPLFYGVHGYYGVESYVMRKSATHNVWGLETVTEHINVLAEMTDAESEAYLLQTFVYGDRDAKTFPQQIAAWKNGDTQRLYEMDAAMYKEAPLINWRLIDRRNRRWIPKIETAIKDGTPTMVVVGARHLCGPNNVIGLLQARGYKLEQL